MFKRLFYIVGLVVVGLIIVGKAYSQTNFPLDPTNDYNKLPGGNDPDVGSGADICPTISGTPSIDTFRVVVNNNDVGLGSWFEWVVYGGTIIWENGATPVNEATSGVYGTVPYFYISHDSRYGTNDPASSGDLSRIAVQWHTSPVNGAWVAVRQHSQWDCYAGPWRIFTNNIFNQKPVFDNFPTDITIAFDDRLSFELPKPHAYDPDNCPNRLTYSYTITGASTNSGDSTKAMRTVDLGIGNNVIKWTVSDGFSTKDSSYTIRVDQQPLISHVAWINPSCAGGSSGSLYVSDTLNYNYSSGFSTYLQYGVNGASYSSNRFFGGLSSSGGPYTVRARVVYDVDKNHDGTTEHTIQYSPDYIITLEDPAALSVNAVPDQGTPFVTVENPTCESSNNGSINVDQTVMTAQNNSMVFGGSDYLLLNKSYNTELSALSVAVWIKVPKVSLTTDGTIISFNSTRQFQLVVRTSTSQGISRLRFQTATPSNTMEYFEPSTIINDGKWHLVVASFSSGVRTVYIDGLKFVDPSTSASTTLGTSAVTSYGAIGASLAATTFGTVPTSGFFKGNMSDLGIWESALDSASVVGIMKHGIASAGPSSYWVLNDLPSKLTSQTNIFTDYGNLVNPSEWGRLTGGSLSQKDAPVLYDWDPDSYPVTSLKNLLPGAYKLTVFDNHGCAGSSVSKTYTLANGDQNPPQLLVNVSYINNKSQRSRVTQSGDGAGGCGSEPAYAYMAVDGENDTNLGNCSVSSTAGGTNDWWQIDLGGPYMINQVRIIHASTDAPTDFYVMISQTKMTSLGDTALSNVYSKHYPSVQQSSPDLFLFNKNARYIRINKVGSGPLVLAEVEAMSPAPASFTRNLYLGDDDCSYVVGSTLAIDPIPTDNCGVVAQFFHDQGDLSNKQSLYGKEFSLVTSSNVVWTVIDDSPDTTKLTMIYNVLDTIKPTFVAPQHGKTDTITSCMVAAGYKVPIPNVTDNYNCPVGGKPNYNLDYLKLKIGSDNVVSYYGSEYDPTSDTDFFEIPATYLESGIKHRLVWVVADYGGHNIMRDTSYLYVETTPQVTDLKYAGLTCNLKNNGSNNGIINFDSIKYQKDKSVSYKLRTKRDTLTSASSLFNTLRPDTFYAWIEVDGCKSKEYYNGSKIIISEPPRIAPAMNTIPVPCFGDSGDIEVFLNSNYQFLHLLGGSNNVVVSPNYSALDLKNNGAVEAWVYLDTLSDTQTNSAAGLVNYMSGGGSYGLRMIGGTLSLVVGNDTLKAPAGSLIERRWTHVAGTWSTTGSHIYVDCSEVASGAAFTTSGTGGSLYMGCLGTGTEKNNLHGFVRFVRVWRNAMSSAQLYANYRFADPINYTNSLVANFPITVNQGSRLQNTADVSIASLSTDYIKWQPYAFYWVGLSPTTPHISRDMDLIKAPAQSYHYYIKAPFSCGWDSIVELPMNDKQGANLLFYNEDGKQNLNGVIVRTTSQLTDSRYLGGLPDTKNKTDDCSYTAQGGEFDPVVDDHGCPADKVTVTWAIADSSGNMSLNNYAFSDTTVVNWHAVDGAGNTSNSTITYWVKDNVKPILTVRDSVVYADAGQCSYRVPDNTTFVPKVWDNCYGNGGSLTNYYPTGGFTSNLNNINIPVGEYNITWIYRDKWLNADTAVQHISVIDNQPPNARCLNKTIDLNESGLARIDSSYLSNNSDDNCTSLATIKILKNIAVNYDGISATTNSTTVCSGSKTGNEKNVVDGKTASTFSSCTSYLSNNSVNNPYWYVSLSGGTKMIYGIRVFGCDLGSPLTNFRVQVSTHPSFAAAFLTYDQLYTGSSLSGGSYYFQMSDGVEGSYVRVQLTDMGAARQLCLSEVEVYGVEEGTSASELMLDCKDVRYSGTPNVFNPMNVLVSVTDDYGNEASCWSDVTVKDVTKPEISPANITVSLNSSGQAQILGSMLLSSSSDACGIDTSWVVPDMVNCSNVGLTPVTLVVRDKNGNTSSEGASVNVVDDLPPVFTVKSNIELPLGPDGYYVIKPQQDIVARVSDNCTDSTNLIYRTIPDTVKCAQRGLYTVTIRITDLKGNYSERSVTVNVVDLLPPTASLNKYTLTVNSDGVDTLFFDNLIPPTSLKDNCGVIGRKWIMYNQTDGWCLVPNEGTGTVTANSNLAPLVNNYGTSSAAYAGTSLNNLNDGASGNFDSDVYMSDAQTGTRQVYYYFSTPYQFSSANVIWHTKTIGTSTQVPVGNISITGNSNAAPINSSYAYDNLKDGGIPTPRYACNDNSNGNTKEIYFDFGANSYNITSVTINWGGTIGAISARDPNNNNAWLAYWNGSSYVSLGAITTTGTPTITVSLPNPTSKIRLSFICRNGSRVAINEFRLYYTDATQDCRIPDVNNFYYWNTTTSAWVSLGSFGTSTPTTQNILNFSPITTNAFRLDMTTTLNRRVGIREFEVWGKPVITYPACTTFGCNDVNKTLPIWLKWEDAAGSSATVQTTVDIIPYFKTTNIQVADCGINGEVWNPTIEGQVGSRTYTYNWTTLIRPTVPGGWPWNGNTVYSYPFDNGGTYSLTSTLTSPMLQNRNIGGGQSAVVSGYYEVNLLITDDHGCKNNFVYGETWDQRNGGGASSEKKDSLCKGTVKRYYATHPDATTYWDSIRYDWYGSAGAIKTSGTGGLYNDWAEFTFPTAGKFVHGYTQTGYQHNISTGPITLNTRTWVDCGGWWYDPCAVVISKDPNILGPLITTSGYMNAGTTYVTLPVDPGWYECKEGVNFTDSVYEVVKPNLLPSSDVCVMDTVWYYVTQKFDHHSWTVTNGRILSGGNWYDDSVRVVWNSYPGVPKVSVTGFNKLNCGSTTEITLNYSGSGSPSFVNCASKDVIQNNTPTTCYYTFQDLQPPVMIDDCHNRIANYANDRNGGINAAGQYPVGVTNVTWTATDYNGNKGYCTHTVTVIDKEPPRFNKYPTDTILKANHDDCVQFLLGTRRDVTGTDNCPANTVTSSADIDYLDDGGGTTWDVTGLTTLDDPTHLHPFPKGVSRVRWIISDNVTTGANTDTTDFLVIVEDKEPPVAYAIPKIDVANTKDNCNAILTVPIPDAGTYFNDNCSPSSEIRVKFVRRSDGLNIDDPYPVGTTTIIWEAEDGAIPSNKVQQSQQVIVRDTQKPNLTPLDNTKITACEIQGHRLQIPTTSDNCQVDSLIVSVTDGGSYHYGDTITVLGFNPYGDRKTKAIKTLVENKDYTVKWRAIDHHHNDSTITNNLRVELQPSFKADSVYHTDLRCGNSHSGQIIVNGVNFENNTTVYYSIDFGNNWKPAEGSIGNTAEDHIFRNLDGGTYGVLVKVNGCKSKVDTVKIIEPTPYSIKGIVSNPYCAEGSDGAIHLEMYGGASAQLELSGTGSQVGSYNDILGDSTNGMVEAWVYLNDANKGASILSKGNSYNFGINGSGYFALTVGGNTYALNSYMPKLKRWYHVAATWTGAPSPSIYIYINGAERGTFSRITSAFPHNGNPLIIGDGFNGIIREARVWNTSYDRVKNEILLEDPSKVLVSGGEAYLGGCWSLTDGLKPYSANKKIANSAMVFGNWKDDIPQPGTYNWSKLGYTNDSIDISGLTADTYKLVFKDNFGCPEDGLTSDYHVEATDERPPYVTQKQDMTLYTDLHDCSHKILASEASSLLPEIINDDGHDCKYSILWDVFSYSTGTGFSDTTLINNTLEIGQNRVNIVVSQNSKQFTSRFDIYVEDNEKPIASAQPLTDVILNSEVGNGNIKRAASEFNNVSEDNCTEPRKLRYEISRDGGNNFEDSIRFSCDDISSSLDIVLKVWDDATTPNYKESDVIRGVVVSDTTKPVFLQSKRTYYGNCSTHTNEYGVSYVDSIQGLYLVPWFDYGDNCEVGEVEYRIVNNTHPEYSYPVDPNSWLSGYDASHNVFYEGTSVIIFRIWDQKGNCSIPKEMLELTVLKMPDPGGINGN